MSIAVRVSVCLPLSLCLCACFRAACVQLILWFLRGFPVQRALRSGRTAVASAAVAAVAPKKRGAAVAPKTKAAAVVPKTKVAAAVSDSTGRLPTLPRTFEASKYALGFTRVAGVDEAGRGPLAGPVVAAACIVPADVDIPGVHDSKKLNEEERDAVFAALTSDSRVQVCGVVLVLFQPRRPPCC